MNKAEQKREKKNLGIKDLEWFKARLWRELRRYDSNLKRIPNTVTCTEENIDNLYNSQFPESTVYRGAVFRYNCG